MATRVEQVPLFAELTADIQTAAGIADDNAPGHKMLEKLQQGLARIHEQWALVANAAADAAAAAAAAAALRNMEKFIIVEKYPGGSRKRRQSKKRRNHKNHNNNQ